MSEFTVRSVDDGASLTLRSLGPERYVAELQAKGLSASIQVDPLDRVDGLERFFAEVAENWRGWKGELTWHAVEGEYSITATCDKAGHVTMAPRFYYGGPHTWLAEVRLTLEAGQLAVIASAAGAFGNTLTGRLASI